MKKILLIVAILVLIGAASYFWFRKTAAPAPAQVAPVPVPPVVVATTSTPVVAQPNVFAALSSAGVFDFWLTRQGAVSYITAQGELFDIPSGAAETPGPVLKISDLHSVSASPDGDAIIVNYGAISNRRIGVFNLSTKSWDAFPEGATAAAWSPDGTEIAYLETIGTKKNIKIVTRATNKTRLITAFQNEDLLISWPEKNTLYLMDSPSRLTSGALIAVDIKNKTATAIATGAGLMEKWLTGGNLGLLLTNPSGLQAFDASGTVLATLPFTALPTKCAFADEFILYCAVPTGRGLGSDYPDNYLQKALYTIDTVEKIDLHSISHPIITTVFASDTIDGDQLKISGGTAYLLNRYDQKIYSLKLGN